MATYIAEGGGTLGYWARINGAWTKVGTGNYYASGTYGSGGLKTMSWYSTQTVSCGGYVDAFRVTVDDGGGGISALNSVTWQTQSSSGTRSATPNGEKITATVRPQ